jgi:hypothetical protein
MKTTGMIDGDMTLNAAIYKKQVCDVCLNCGYAKCINTIDGCEAFRRAIAANSRKYRRGKGRDGDEGKGIAKGYDAVGVG